MSSGLLNSGEVQTIKIVRGDDETLSVTITDDDGQPVPVNTYTSFQFGAKENLNDTDLAIAAIDCDKDTDGANGVVTVEIPGSATQSLLGQYVGEFTGVDSGLKVTTFSQFNLDILADVIV